MLFMVVEKWKDRDAEAVYRRLRERGRGTPDGLSYVGSWVEANFDRRCWRVMGFEIMPVGTGRDTAGHMEARL